jgi:hypothetical protein
MSTKAHILQAIRSKCADCCCGSRSEVAKCHLQGCSLHPFRFGKDPNSSTRQTHQEPMLQKGSFERQGFIDGG